MKLTCFKALYNIFQYRNILNTFIFSSFFDLFVVDFKILIKLSSIFFIFMFSTSLSSLESNLVSFKILSFRGDILKNVYKEIPSLQASIFPLYTLILNSEFEKKIDKNLVFFTKNAAKRLSNSLIDRKCCCASLQIFIFKICL